ncbi:jhy protein homolog isoform X1 [Crotalus tigris]|uniref:jhy protein homolog isoform X1 n=1 Tax=Crotalus tigris TaxID=88082 RepID=UPI00192F76E1|nr:jhy protein homolog isoform X1 [Crotalus tigris]XP_039220023.1 jhy protein homolog isoform X1 [Crotalus tigris]XP_039220024.1 jhy protein homolog isoform X1 [Crotalus tigris]
MNINSPSPKGLTEAHRRYSFLQTASEGLDQNESDSESLVEETQYQWELQRRICETQERVSWAYEEEADDRMEKDSLEDMCLSEEESHGEETQRPSEDQDERRNPENESSWDSIVDEYSELRYDPNWKDSQKGKSFLQLEDSHQEELRNFSVTSLDLACSPSQGRVLSENCQGSPPNISSATDGEFWKPSGDKPGDGRDRPFQLDKKGRKTGVLYHYGSNDSLASSGCRVRFKEPKPRPEKDFIEKNKHTLGLATQQNSSYLRLHGKKQRGGCQEKIIVAHQSARRPPMDGVSSSQAASLQVTPLSKRCTQPPLGTQVELRSQPSGGNNLLELENACPDSIAYRETSEVQQDSRCAPHCELYPPACLSIANHSSEDSPLFSGQAPYLLQHHAKKRSMNLAFAGTPLQRSSYHNFPGFPSPCAGEKCQPGLENISGLHHPYFYRCTVSEPFPSHGKRWNPLGHKRVSYAHDGGQKEPVNGAVASGEPCHIYTEAIPNNYAFEYSGSSQPPAPPPVKRTLSPTARLIQAVERHHRELSQLADDHLARNQLASMFPPIIQRGESDSQLHLESGEETQPVLSRSNSEGYLLQMEKQKERRGKKGHRKGSRAKGYVKMDVRLGGLGPDYETIKEKSEKMKHQKVYAKQVNEQNLKNISSARKPQLKTEDKSVVSRQKALEYAKTIPKPRLFVSRSSEQETKEEKNLARTLNGENLPPISSLESLQNRHEKEKQVVAAFKTLHIV